MIWSGIEGSWWRLRRATWADEAAIADHGRGADPLWIGISASAPPERTRQVIEEFVMGDAGGDFGLVHLVVSKESDAIVGMVGAQRRGSDTVELVYGVAPAWRGRGLATEVLAAVTKAACSQDRRRFELIIDSANAASVRVAEKCGYRLVGVRRSLVEATGESFEDLVYVPTPCPLSA